MDNSLTPEQQNALIEDAFHTYPMASLPRDLTSDIMARIQSVPAPRPFRLTWSDFFLASALSLCLGAIWFSIANLPPLLFAQIRKEGILLYQYLLVNMRWLLPVLSLGLSAFLSALTVAYLRYELQNHSEQ